MTTNKQNEQPVDKIDVHNRQQLSALVDGELSSDEARFLLRRLQHDPELQACQERWSLLGDALRGQAVAPAPSGFAARVAAAVAAEPLPQAVPRRQVRAGWQRWGGGAALAASVAVVALFMGRQTLDDAEPVAESPTQVIASEAVLPAPANTTQAAASQAAVLVASVPAAAAAAARRQDSARRASATRTQQAGRSAQSGDAPQPMLASSGQPLAPAPAAAQALPFGNVGALQARPWPRSDLGPAAGGALNARYPVSTPGATFYPFDPRLQDDLQVHGTRD